VFILVILAVCHPLFMAIIIISTSNSPYEQWLIDGLVVLVMWQWWQQTLVWLLWGLLEVVIAEYEQNPLPPCEQRLAVAAWGLGVLFW
jgi:hypothetical protein